MHIFEKVLPADFKSFIWIEHKEPLKLGPFLFEADLPVPLASPENTFAQDFWLDVPYRGRPALPTGHDESEERFELSAIMEAYLQGHISPGAPDAFRLVDQVGRCMLILSYFSPEHPLCQEINRTFTSITEPVKFFDVLVRQALSSVQEGSAMLNLDLQKESLEHFVQAMLKYHAAFLIAPASSIIIFNKAILCYDLSARTEFKGMDKWTDELLLECRHNLHLAMADEEIRDKTPAYFLLAQCREQLGDQEGAVSAYKKFLANKESSNFPDLYLHSQEAIKA